MASTTPATRVVTVRSGAGGTDSQDWAEMLLRMYLRWAERRGFEVEMEEASEGRRRASSRRRFIAHGENAYGLFAAERGVHRLVRISPFDAQSRRHTAFAQVDVAPLVDDDVEVELDEEDIRVDTYRASGAGGQHVNKTDSAVRLTHVPTGIVVQCQNERSQTQNKATAMRMLRARLLEEEERKRAEEMAAERGEQKAVEWGSQIRSYTLHPSTSGSRTTAPGYEVGRRQPGARRRPRRLRPRVPAAERRRQGRHVSVDAGGQRARGGGARRGPRGWRPDHRGDRPRRRAGARADRPEAARGRLRPRGRRRGVPPVPVPASRQASSSRASGARTCPAEVALASRPARALLAGERTALNFLGHLSGVATLTARFVEAVRRAPAPRSSTPARRRRGCARSRRPRSRAGGGTQPPHGPLRRDPHQGEPHRPRRRSRRGGRSGARGPARPRRSRSSAATSTRSPTRSAPAPTGCCSTTWTSRTLREAVAARDALRETAGRRSRPRAAWTWTPSRAIAETGVDFISVGALTHSAPALDFSLLLEA